MKTTQIISLLALGIVLIFAACNKQDVNTDTFQAVVDAAGGFNEPTTGTEVLDTETYTEESDTAVWLCTTETLSVEDAAGGKDGFPLFSPNSSVIYPGSLLQGNSLDEATPKTINVDRAGGVISTDVVDGSIAPSFEVDELTKSNVTIALNNIIANSTGVIPANFSFTYSNIQSKEQFALEVGVSIEGAFGDLEANLGFSTDKEYNRYFVKLDQSYYTMSFDLPTSLDDLFAPDVTPEDLARYVGPGNPATYISDVTYGRIYYMLVESTSSVTEMDAAIAGSFNKVTTSVEGEVEIDYFQSLKDLKITVYAYGGESTGTIQTIGVGLGNLSPLIDLLAESTDIGTGKPLSYVVRSVYDNQIVSTQLATQYDVTNCKLSGIGSPPPYTEHWTGNVVSTFGPVGAAFNASPTEIILINIDGTEFLRSTPGVLEGPFSIDLLGNTDCPLNGIGAISYTEGIPNSTLAFDLAGINYAYMSSAGTWSAPQPITNSGGGTCPFNLFGVGAIPSSVKGDDFIIWAAMDSDGKVISYFYEEPNNEWLGTVDLNDPFWFQNPIPFDAIGAGSTFKLGESDITLWINKLGTRYVLQGDLFGDGDNIVLGPFDL